MANRRAKSQGNRKTPPFLQEQSQSHQERPVGTRARRQNFLIVCEGERTEPNYFESFDLQKEIVQMDVRGLGYNTISLVRRAVALRAQGHYHQVWCVFDRDDFPREHFEAALALAKQEKIKVAYSNQAFELWYVLHFDFLQAAITRGQYIQVLEARLGHAYKKNSATIYQEIRHLQGNALRNARRLLTMYSPSKPEQDCPSTSVHLLVEQLNRFLRNP